MSATACSEGDHGAVHANPSCVLVCLCVLSPRKKWQESCVLEFWPQFSQGGDWGSVFSPLCLPAHVLFSTTNVDFSDRKECYFSNSGGWNLEGKVCSLLPRLPSTWESLLCPRAPFFCLLGEVSHLWPSSLGLHWSKNV